MAKDGALVIWECSQTLEAMQEYRQKTSKKNKNKFVNIKSDRKQEEERSEMEQEELEDQEEDVMVARKPDTDALSEDGEGDDERQCDEESGSGSQSCENEGDTIAMEEEDTVEESGKGKFYNS